MLFLKIVLSKIGHFQNYLDCVGFIQVSVELKYIVYSRFLDVPTIYNTCLHVCIEIHISCTHAWTKTFQYLKKVKIKLERFLQIETEGLG